MAKSRKKRPDVPTQVVRRPAAERKRLSPEFEAFARSDEKRLKGKPQTPRLRDPRDHALIPGVANRDARQVFESRIEAMSEAAKEYESPSARRHLARLCAEAFFLGLWRGRSLTGFDVMAEAVLELAPEEARKLAEEGADVLDLELDQASDEAIAVWVRMEAAMIEAGQTARLAPFVNHDGEECLRIEITVENAPETLHAVGRRMTPLARDREEARVEEERRKHEWEKKKAQKKKRGTLEE